MKFAEERSRSVWMDVSVAPNARPLKSDPKVDVVVVGAGIAGLSVAYELLLRGRSVAVVDRGPIAGGMTSRTTAHLAPVCDDSLAELLSMRGEEMARAFQKSQEAAVDRIEAIQRDEGIECEFRRLDGILFLDPSSEDSVLDEEMAAAAKIGVSVERSAGLPLKGLDDVPYLRYPRQATFHPLRYLEGLCRAIESKGGKLHPHSPVGGIRETDERVVVQVAGGLTVSAGFAVIATNSPINERFALHTKQAPYRTYAMAFELERGLVADALYWDTLDPYHYVRLTSGPKGKDFLIVGGADHKSGEANDATYRLEALEAWIRSLVPELGKETHRWSGQVMDTLDYCGFIGLNPGSKRTYVATGDSGQGITHGVVASLIISDLVCDGASSYQAVYDPTRKPLKAARTFVQENTTVLTNLAEYLAPGELASVNDLEPGHGAIIRDGMRKIAAFRDEDGTLYQRSAVCSHLGCHLQWNAFERTWDCPCHGSHFAPDGTVLNGPAISPLTELPER